MSLRQKVALIVTLAVASLFMVDYVLHSRTFSNRFERDANEMAEEDIGHVVDLIEGEVRILGAGAERLASALNGKRMEHVRGLEWLTRTGAYDVLLIFDESGTVMHHRALDPISHEPIAIEELPNDRLSEFNLLRCSLRASGQAGLERVEEGVITTPRGPVLIASRTATLAGGQEFQVAVGRFLSGRWLKHFQGEGAPLELHLLKGYSQTKEVQNIVDLFALSPTGRVVEPRGDALVAWGIFYDLGGSPAFLIGQEQDDRLASIWTDLHGYSTLSLVALIILCPLVLLALLQLLVTGPLWQLIEHSKVVSQDSTTEKRLGMKRNDDIGQLANEFDSMLDQLAVSRTEVIQLARKAGASDIATGVLHNVGNSLNSVGISARLASEKLAGLPLKDLDVISSVLQSNRDELHAYLTGSEQGKAMPAYVEAVNQRMQDNSKQLLEELSELLRGIAIVEELVANLEPTGGGKGLTERLSLEEQLDSVLEMCGNIVECDCRTQIVRDYRPVAKVKVDRHKLSEVMLQLLRASLQQSGSDENIEVVLGIRPHDAGGIAVTVSSNGLGLEESELTGIFAMDNSMDKSDGRAGLHNASTSAIEMGAELTVQSEGRGQGTCYCLLLPETCLVA